MTVTSPTGRLVIAPDSFKGTYSAVQVSAAIARGARTRAAGSALDVVELPVADGGEGTLDALRVPMGLTLVDAPSCNPWGRPRTGRYGLRTGRAGEGVAVVEVAESDGLTVAHDGARDPVTAGTRGTGMLVVDALRRGAQHILIAAGGSATTDGGRGLIEEVDRVGGIGSARLSVLTDVRTRFDEAAVVFGPQKGANATQVAELTARLRRFGAELPRNPQDVVGGGAAGGLAGGLWAWFDAAIVPGANFVLEHLRLDTTLRGAVGLVVGEGRLDGQSADGKIVSALIERAAGIEVHAVVGSLGPDADRLSHRFASVHIATDEDAMAAAGATIAGRYLHPAARHPDARSHSNT